MSIVALVSISAAIVIALGCATSTMTGAADRTRDSDNCFTATCHAIILAIKIPHAPVRDRLCGTCHLQVHADHPGRAGDEYSLSTVTVSELCLQCHETLKNRLQAASVVHRPVEEGRCGACHEPHGTDLPTLFPRVALRSEGEWPCGPQEVETTKLCWQCHDRMMIAGDESRPVTRFRDGDRNLHYLHANFRKRRKCTACHEVHAGQHDKLFRDSVPFGTAGWQLPINITLTRDGGYCIVGCHVPRTYSRVTSAIGTDR